MMLPTPPTPPTPASLLSPADAVAPVPPEPTPELSPPDAVAPVPPDPTPELSPAEAVLVPPGASLEPLAPSAGLPPELSAPLKPNSICAAGAGGVSELCATTGSLIPTNAAPPPPPPQERTKPRDKASRARGTSLFIASIVSVQRVCRPSRSAACSSMYVKCPNRIVPLRLLHPERLRFSFDGQVHETSAASAIAIRGYCCFAARCTCGRNGLLLTPALTPLDAPRPRGAAARGLQPEAWQTDPPVRSCEFRSAASPVMSSSSAYCLMRRSRYQAARRRAGCPRCRRSGRCHACLGLAVGSSAAADVRVLRLWSVLLRRPRLVSLLGAGATAARPNA